MPRLAIHYRSFFFTHVLDCPHKASGETSRVELESRDIKKYISSESGNIGYIVDYQWFKWQHEKLQPVTLLIANNLSGNINDKVDYSESLVVVVTHGNAAKDGRDAALRRPVGAARRPYLFLAAQQRGPTVKNRLNCLLTFFSPTSSLRVWFSIHPIIVCRGFHGAARPCPGRVSCPGQSGLHP